MELSRTANGVAAQVARPAGATQKLTLSGTSAKTTEFTENYTVVRIASDNDFYLNIGATGDAATVNDAYYPAGVVDHIYVMAGDFIHVIQASGAGFVTITVAS